MAIGLTYNTKEAAELTSFEQLLDPKLKGRIAIPSFDWFGPQFLYAVNGALGGTNDNVDRGMQFIADLVKKNNAILLSSADAGMQAFTRGEIVAMPFWNGRTNLLVKNDVPVKMVYPKGWIATGNGHVILKNTKFYKEANNLINNLLEPGAAGEARNDVRLSAIEQDREASGRPRIHARSGRRLRAGGEARLRHHDRQRGEESRPLEQGSSRVERAPDRCEGAGRSVRAHRVAPSHQRARPETGAAPARSAVRR